MKSHPVILPQSVRYFVCHENGRIQESAARFPAGKKLYLEPPTKANLDGYVHDAAPFTNDGQMCFVIISEIGIPGLLGMLSKLKYINVEK